MSLARKSRVPINRDTLVDQKLHKIIQKKISRVWLINISCVILHSLYDSSYPLSGKHKPEKFGKQTMNMSFIVIFYNIDLSGNSLVADKDCIALSV